MSKKKNLLSKRRGEVLLFCYLYVQKDIGDFYPPLFPTLQEIADGIGLNSTSNISYYIDQLIETGFLAEYRRGDALTRNFGLTKKGISNAVRRLQDESTGNHSNNNHTGAIGHDGGRTLPPEKEADHIGE